MVSRGRLYSNELRARRADVRRNQTCAGRLPSSGIAAEAQVLHERESDAVRDQVSLMQRTLRARPSSVAGPDEAHLLYKGCFVWPSTVLVPGRAFVLDMREAVFAWPAN